MHEEDTFVKAVGCLAARIHEHTPQSTFRSYSDTMQGLQTHHAQQEPAIATYHNC
jgi:hypothetical protein